MRSLGLSSALGASSTALAIPFGMTASLARFVGFLLVTATLLACASTQSAEPRYAEYSLDANRHPESIDCFYECLASSRESFRDACFARCEGVVATTTSSPCPYGSPALCRSYEIEVEESCDDDDGEAALAVLDILSLGAEVALDASEAANDRDTSSSRSKSRRSSKAERSSRSSSPKSIGSKASSGTAPLKPAIGAKKR
jgi:hypothetical protein